ncbi:MAG: hypothetical protein C0599_05180 [Salinivirgaceae bacterium]|nr:MAG: hypothetical protein C0599_05180 [Salinivirgaceae bacterium]
MTRFEKELSAFRYSLYPMLDTMDYNQITNYQMSENIPLMKSISEFYKSHQEEFKKYKYDILVRHKDVDINLDKFVEDQEFYKSEFYVMLSDKNSSESQKLEEIKNTPLYQFMIINPISHCGIYITMHHSQNNGVQSVAKRTVVNQLAAPKIKTIKNSKTDWTIYFDYYFEIYEFEYNIETSDLAIKSRWIRKKD